jgi:hypothetical protein
MDLLNSPEAALGFLAACAAKATVLLTVAWIVTMAWRNQSAAMRHRVWAAGILGALSLPLLTMVLPAWPSAALGGARGAWSTPTAETMASFENLPAMIVNASAASPPSSRWAGIVLGIWIFWLVRRGVAAHCRSGAAGVDVAAGNSATSRGLAALCCGIVRFIRDFTPSASVAIPQSSGDAADLGIFEAGGAAAGKGRGMASKPSAHGPFPRTVAHRASRLDAANRG